MRMLLLLRQVRGRAVSVPEEKFFVGVIGCMISLEHLSFTVLL